VAEPIAVIRPPARAIRWLRPALAGAAVVVVAVGAALAGRSSAGQLGAGESLSTAAATFLSRIGTGLPLGYAFAAGMVSAVNPCGFALLPAYLGLYLGSERSPRDLGRRLARAIGIGLVVSASFVLLFGAAGLLVLASASRLAGLFPWIGLAVGLLLVTTGAALLGGAHLSVALIDRLGERAARTAKRRGLAGYAAYGVAYAAGSLGCTLPIFLTVVAAGFTAGGPVQALLQFVLYGLGMGAVLTALTLVTAVVEHAAFRSIRRVAAGGPYLQPVGAGVLLLAGGYIVYYWLALGGLLPGTT
jgi:cytochrome c-type biogenesis protein